MVLRIGFGVLQADPRRVKYLAIRPQMPWKAYGQMNDVELKALWVYLRTVPPLEKGHKP